MIPKRIIIGDPTKGLSTWDGTNLISIGSVGTIGITNPGSGYVAVPTVSIAPPTDAGGIQPFGTFNQTPVPALANSNSIEVSIGSVKINRISSLSLSLSIPRLPIYYLGNVVPSFVKSIYPIQLECSFVLQQDQYNLQSLSVLPFNFNDESAFSIRLNDVNGIPVNFDFNNKLSYLVNESENFSAAVGNPLGVTVRYKGFLK